MQSELMSRKTVMEMVTAYEDARIKVIEGYGTLEMAEKELVGAFGSQYSDFGTLPQRYYSSYDQVKNEVLLRLKMNGWKAIINRLGIRKLMSIKEIINLDKKLENAEAMPEIEVSTIFSTFQMLADQSQEYILAAMKEVYEILHPGKTAWSHLKTNERNARNILGKKVILTWFVEGSYSQKMPYRVCYRDEEKLNAIDKAFHNLDGKGLPDGYKSELVDAINTSPDGSGQTEYFKFHAYSNRNLHLEFRRMDLVSRMNQVCGNSTELMESHESFTY